MNDFRSLDAIRATARELRAAALAVDPGVLRALDEETHPTRLRSTATDLLDRALAFLDEVVALWGVAVQRQRSKNQTFETAIRSAVRDRLGPGDLAALARVDLSEQRVRLERCTMDSVLILECANAISQVRATADALQKLATDGGSPQPSSGDRRRFPS